MVAASSSRVPPRGPSPSYRGPKPAPLWPSCVGCSSIGILGSFCLVRTPHQHLLWPQGLSFTETALRMGKGKPLTYPGLSEAGHVPTERPQPAPTPELLLWFRLPSRHGAPFHEQTESWAVCWGSRALCGGAHASSLSSSGLHTQGVPAAISGMWGPAPRWIPTWRHPDFCPLFPA